MMNLNDDCISHIITFLNQNDQVQLKRVCRRLNILVNIYWQRKYKKWYRYTEKGKDRQYEQLVWMVYHLHNYVKVLNLGFVSSEDMDILCSNVFPNTQTLIADAENVESDVLNVFIQNFPNLNYLYLVGNVDPSLIANLKYLTELQLQYVFCEDDFSFQPLFKNLKLRKLSFYNEEDFPNKPYSYDIETITLCETLEEFSLDVDLVNLIVDKLPELRNLRLIECFIRFGGSNNLLQKIVEIFGTRIHTLTSDFSIIYFPMHILSKMPNLKKWSMNDDFVGRFDKDTLAEGLFNLEELTLMNTKLLAPTNYSSEELQGEYSKLNIIEVIAACKNLQKLTIPIEWLNKDLILAELSQFLRSERKRKAKLKLTCLRNIQKPEVDIKRLAEAYKHQMVISVANYSEKGFQSEKLFYAE